MKNFHYYTDSLGTLVLVALCLLNLRYIGSSGGALPLSVICAFLYLVSIAYKKYQLEISFVVLFLVSIIALNFLGYIEIYKHGLSITYILVFVLTFALILISFLVVTIGPTRPRAKEKQSKMDVTFEIRKRVIQRLMLAGYGFTFIVGTGALFSGLLFAQAPEISTTKWFRLSYHTFVWAILSFAICLIGINRLPDFYIEGIITKERISILNIRKRLLYGYVLIVALGAACEFYRGLWVLWVESVLLLGITMLIGWKIWKHIFEPKVNEEPELGIEFFTSIELLNNPRQLLAYLIFCIILFCVYVVGSIILLKSG